MKLEVAGNRLTDATLGDSLVFRPLKLLQVISYIRSLIIFLVFKELSLETNALTQIPSAALVNQKQTLTNLNLGLNNINDVSIFSLLIGSFFLTGSIIIKNFITFCSIIFRKIDDLINFLVGASRRSGFPESYFSILGVQRNHRYSSTSFPGKSNFTLHFIRWFYFSRVFPIFNICTWQATSSRPGQSRCSVTFPNWELSASERLPSLSSPTMHLW